MAGRQGFEPRSDGPEPPVLPLDDLPALGFILGKRAGSFKAKHGGATRSFKFHRKKSSRRSDFFDASMQTVFKCSFWIDGSEFSVKPLKTHSLEAFTSQQQDFEPSVVGFAEPAIPPAQRGGMRGRCWVKLFARKAYYIGGSDFRQSSGNSKV
jgi:hypothetical protein